MDFSEPGRRIFAASLFVFAGAASGQTSERGPVYGAEHVLPPFSGWNYVHGDFDLDGDVDLVQLATVTPDAHLLRNDGFGRFRIGDAFFAKAYGQTQSFGPAFGGDFDGDGVRDVGVHYRPNSGVSSVKFFRGTSGGLTPVVPEVAGGAVIVSAFVADFDGDADDDFLLTSSSASTLYLRSGPFSFVATGIWLPPGTSSVVDTADFDGDGDVDLLAQTTAAAGPGARVLLNSGAGLFGFWLPVPSTHPNVRFAGDGTGAAVVVESFTDATGLAQDAIYDFVGGAAIPAASYGRTTAAVVAGAADFDGDGVDELVRTDAATVEIGPLGPGSSFVSRTAAPPQFGVSSFIRPFDVDGDGDLDLPYYDPARGSRLLRRRADGTFGESEAEPAFPPAPSGVRFAPIDVDGDGDVDLARYGPNAPLRFAINDGRGRFAVGPPEGPAIAPLGTGLRVDVDSDGDEDLVVVGSGGLAAIRNDGASGWSVVFAPLPQTAATTCVAARAADLDADGDVDVAVLFNGGDKVYVYRNDAGAFAAPTPYLQGSLVVRDFVAADVDLDGDLDLAIAEALLESDGVSGYGIVSPMQSWALLNVGACTFVPQPLPAQFFGMSADAGDIDADGDEDIVFGDTVYRREPWGYAFHGNFASGSATRQRRFADLDGDGVLDMVSGGFRAKGLGGGTFGSQTVTVPRPLISSLPLGAQVWGGSFFAVDLDGDADADLVGPTLWPTGPLWNYDRALQPAAPAHVGGVAGIEVFAPGGTPYVVAAAFADLAGGAIVPGWGTLHLDPATAFVVAGGATDASGLGAVPLGVPNDPGLVGLSLHWQAAFPTLPRLSNHRLLTISAP